MYKSEIGTFSAVLIFSFLLFVFLTSNFVYAELTPPLPGAPSYINIGVEKAHEMLEKSPEQIILLDVRTEEEYSTEIIPGAINVPLSDLENRIDELDASKTLIVHDQSGGKSNTASATLAQHGFIVYNMPGGINAWKERFATSTTTPKPTTTTQTSVGTPLPTVSSAVTPAATATPAFVPTLTPTEPPEEKKEVPGFDAPLAIAMLIVVVVLLRRK